MDIQPKYMELIHPNASFLLRPKTGLNDMLVEVDPGSGKKSIEDGAHFTLDQTEPNTNLDAFLSTLDADTRQYLQLLVAGGAQGIGGRGKQLSNAFRRFQPFVHYTAKLNKAIAARRVELSRVIHNFGQLTTELGRNDAAVKRFVTSSRAALGNFANEQESVQAAFEEFPSALQAARAGLASSNRFSQAAYPTLIKLIPQAQALTPAFRATERLFDETTEPIRDQIRPFTREVRPVLTHGAEAAEPFEKTVRNFGNSLGGFNSFLNELAYNPKGLKESYLFYLPWLNHNFNASFNIQDAGGPILRSLTLISCTGANLGYGYVRERTLKGKPYLQTLLELAGVPREQEIPVSFPTDFGTCEFKETSK
jgi:phospholipid/cholesterol/gamma-HCH transport system substrate-binding protein